jgi:hypothetical protein
MTEPFETDTMKIYQTLVFAKVVARAWSDPTFKAQLLSDPHAMLQAEGVVTAQGVTITVVENTENLVHLVLPVKPADHELSVEALQGIGVPTPHAVGCLLCFTACACICSVTRR